MAKKAHKEAPRRKEVQRSHKKKAQKQMPTLNTFATQQTIGAVKSLFASFSVSKEEKLKVWSILVALRGPDSKNKALKEATTNVIRYHLFGSTVVNGTTIRSNADSYTREQVRRNARQDHFVKHAKKAFEALGLPW